MPQGISSNPVLDRLERLVAEVGDLQSKLILLVGNGGKTKLLRSLGERLQSLPVNVGAKLGQRLAATPVSERGFSTNELLRDITDSARSDLQPRTLRGLGIGGVGFGHHRRSAPHGRQH
ncbi:MAG: BREX-3 system P-loop-containing protein BrxF [Proteobacteria bacterium]|nr:BREX-3 system P-loop-containing protein BrxF [Pseudomonadota bacterium]